jgi:hypothetical protein
MKKLVRTLVLLGVLVPMAVLGQASSAQPAAPEGAGDPMAGWRPPKKITPAEEKKTKADINALFKKMEQAGQKGELDAAAALVDFPVLMLTDTKEGDSVGDQWDEQQWREVMTPFYAQPMKDMRVTHNPKVFLVTEALASVDDDWTMTMGKKKTAGRSSMLLVRKAGEWKIKAMVEGGWGDMAMPEKPAGATPPAPGGGTQPPAGTPPAEGGTPPIKK